MKQGSTVTITPGEKPGTGTCTITLADGTVITDLKTKQAAFEQIVKYGQSGKIEIRDWRIMRDTILQSKELPWHNEARNSFPEIIRALTLLVETIDDETDEAPECAAASHTDLAGAMLEMCACGKKHARIYCKNGWKTSLLRSKGEALFYLEKAHKEFLSQHEYNVVKKQIEESALEYAVKVHFDPAMKEMHIVFRDGKESIGYSTKVEICDALLDCWALDRVKAVEVLELIYEVITTEGFDYVPEEKKLTPKVQVYNLFSPGELNTDPLDIISLVADIPKEPITNATVLMYKKKGYARIFYLNKDNELCASLPIKTRAFGMASIGHMRDSEFPLEEADLVRLTGLIEELEVPVE